MHELSLAESVVQIVEDTRKAQGFGRVEAVCLEIGALSAVEVETLRFCFDIVAKDTPVEGARLEIIEVPGMGRCSACHADVPLAVLYDVCPQCGGYPVDITQGTEMRVKAVEVGPA